MIHSDEERQFERLLRVVAPGSRLIRSRPLTGGISARLDALEIERPEGQRARIVLRRHGPADLAGNPNVAADEFRLLQQLHSAGIPVPKPLHLDASGDLLSTPAIVIEFVEGKPESSPSDVLRLAETLIQIHELDRSRFDLSFLRRRDALPPKRDGVDERVRDALERAWPLPQRNEAVLLHGDFWPGNTLWNDGRLVAVVDWEDAAVGDPLADLGYARLELLWAFLPEAMNSFSEHYLSRQSALEATDLAYWDLYAVLRLATQIPGFGLHRESETVLRERQRLFTTQALKAISL
jgi:aminoglycoside phosphotransferase (APT) family kinase protein